MIEVQVHSSLRAFLREQGLVPIWPHHLTMARLVARALRLGRPALIQTGVFSSGTQGRYRLSYLAPALIWTGPVIVVTPVEVQQQLLQVEIPQLRQWLQTEKDIKSGDRWPNEDFQGLLLTSPESWLADKLHGYQCFPNNVPTLIDAADDLEGWAHDVLTACIQPGDWDELMLKCPHQADVIRDARVQLTRIVFQHPPNPYECYLIAASEQDILRHLYKELESWNFSDNLPPAWRNFWQQQETDAQLMWASIARHQGQFSLYCGPVEVATALSKVWTQQPVVLIGGALDLEPDAFVYRQQLGLGELTCLKFSPDRQSELIQLYVPDQLPMPNTPEFQDALIQEVRTIILSLGYSYPLTTTIKRPIVLLVGDVPLKAQLGAVLAAEFGSVVQVENTRLNDTSILVTGWDFWRQHQNVLPAPQLSIVATLPIPSLENPLVASRVAYYKQQRQDWFRLYLLPAALRELQRAIAPVRECQGVVALLDSRVNNRSYGQQVLVALSPFARINYLDASWFTNDFLKGPSR
ncbi:MAG: helicase C-terminal domain-containing protein [Chamaesiphon sp.]